MDKRILWVDDEIELLKSHVTFLQGKGYKVDTATNGADALSLVKGHKFDVMLLDESMPGRGGLETLVEIKESDPSLPVVMITKNEEERLMDNATRALSADAPATQRGASVSTPDTVASAPSGVRGN